jgi:hypothetical protein
MWGRLCASRKATRKSQLRTLSVGLAAIVLCGSLFVPLEVQAGSSASPPAPTGTPTAPTGTPTAPTNTTTWGGLNWGVGIAADFDVGGTRVANASLVNNIVRVTDTSSNVDVSFVLESHYFFALPQFIPSSPIFGYFEPPGGCNPSITQTTVTPNGNTVTTQTKTQKITPDNSSTCTEWAHGPFIAVEVGGGTSATPSGSNGPITGYALGWMIGFRHPTAATSSSTSSWNFGIGLRVDPKAQVLGDGVVANQPLPAGETAVRYKTEPRPGVMLLSSFSF